MDFSLTTHVVSLDSSSCGEHEPQTKYLMHRLQQVAPQSVSTVEVSGAGPREVGLEERVIAN